VTEDATEYVNGKFTINPAVLKLAEKLIARGADPNVRIWHPDVVEWREARTLLDAKHGSEIIRKLGGVTTAVWANRQVKIVTGAKELEGEALQALTELALAGLMKKLGAEQARIEKKVSAMLKARTDAVSKALAPFGVHPLTLLWLARGVHGRDLFDRGMLQIAAELRVQPEKELAAKIHPLLRALCDAGAPVDVRDARGSGALDAYLGRARGYNFTPDTALVRALIPKSREVITRAVAEHLAGIESPLPPEINAVLDILVEAGADLTEPRAFSRLCRARRPDLVRRALEAGADPAWDSDSSDCALEQALYVDDVNVVEILLDAGAPPDIGREGSSLAFFKTRSGEALEALLRHKLDVTLRGGYDRRTLFDEAVERAVGLLSNWDGYGPEVNNAAVRFVAHLVSSGWSLDAVDRDGKTPRARLQAIKNERGRAALAEAGLLN